MIDFPFSFANTERERKVEHDEFLDRADQLRRRHHRDFHRAALHRRGHLLLAAERAVREDLDLDLAAALLVDDLDQLLRAQPLRVVDRVDDRELDVAFLDVGGGRRRGGEQHGNGQGHGGQYLFHGCSSSLIE